MERQLFEEEEGALKLNTREKLLTQEHQILMIVQPLVFEVDHHSIGKPRRTKMFPVGSITRINSPTCMIIVSRLRKPGSTTIIPRFASMAKVYLSHGHQVEIVPAQPGNKTSLSAINQAVVVSYLN